MRKGENSKKKKTQRPEICEKKNSEILHNSQRVTLYIFQNLN